MKSLPGRPVTDAERQSRSLLISRILPQIRGRTAKRMIALVVGSHKDTSGNREAGKMKRAIFLSKDATETFPSRD